jgi:hypothetical protein
MSAPEYALLAGQARASNSTAPRSRMLAFVKAPNSDSGNSRAPRLVGYTHSKG